MSYKSIFCSFFFLLGAGLVSIEGKVFTKCELAKTMKAHGFPKSQLGTWVCIAYHESRLNTKTVNHATGDYGIFQISHYYWCSDSNVPGKGCKITCKSLLVDDISGSMACARKVFTETQKGKTKNGFTAWVTYKKHCKGNQSKWIKGCGL
ncbi:lysozyme C-like [Cylas formicarius]|uniref:lysozyme C-like n=1 Tax=Cylas formicarius TaxID=197179 RepID=UPI00295857CB|nr:lysozyme C-like [Cylas formicarius]